MLFLKKKTQKKQAIQGYGEYALAGATISSDYLEEELIVEAYGYFAGSGATLHCHCGKTCSLYCAGNGCVDMQLLCDKGSTCNYYCDEENGISCPIITDHSSEYAECKQTAQEDDDDDDSDIQSGGNDGNDKKDENHKWYTSAGHGASREEKESADADIDDTIKLCRYVNECVNDDEEDQNIISKEDGEIQCSGYQSCYLSQLYALTGITCGGLESCYKSTSIKTDGSIECSGGFSCHGSEEIMSSDGNIVCNGPDSCAQVKNIIVNDYNKIQCDGPSACSDSVLNGDIGGIECNGRNSCANSEINFIDDVAATLLCNGHKSCSKVITNNVESIVECHGTDSCKQSKIYSKYVLGHGYRSLQKSVIDSTGIDTMIVESYGYYSGLDATINCQYGSVCSLICMNNGCEGLVFNCYDGATCTFQCDVDKNVDCPQYNQGIINEKIKQENIQDLLMINDGDDGIENMNKMNVVYHRNLMIEIIAICVIVSILLIIGYYHYSKCKENKEYELI